jgi:SAM-dependent methyltransferase
MELLNRQALEASPVVANCAMNRERRLASYARELGVDPLEILRDFAGATGRAAWLDLCCGTGRALIEASQQCETGDAQGQIEIQGVDLVGVFDANPLPQTLTLQKQSIEQWAPSAKYALITCVHGLHYVGDKLAAIAKVVACLDVGGHFVANLDLAGFRFHDGREAGRAIAAWLRKNNMEYDRRRRLLRCNGPRRLDVPFRYVGADDRVGPNYTGQAAVASYYQSL